jgi:protein FRG1
LFENASPARQLPSGCTATRPLATMSNEKVRSTRLKFKGEHTKKKRKREGDDLSGSSTRRREDGDNDDESWVIPENPSEIRGPTFIIHPFDPTPICVNFDSARNRIVLHSLNKDQGNDQSELSLLDRTPTDTSQVWVTTRVAGSPTINLRTGTGDGKFLSCDAHGLVSADKEARGPQEEWTPVLMPDGMVAFMNVYEKYLSVDEVAGGTLQLRGDSDEVGFGERFWIKIQNKYKKEATEEEKKKKEGNTGLPKIDEASSKLVPRVPFVYQCLNGIPVVFIRLGVQGDLSSRVRTRRRCVNL